MEYSHLREEAENILKAWQGLSPKPVHDLPDDIAAVIDHTLLKPDADESAVKKLCAEARQYKFASVCVNPVHVEFCVKQLAETEIPVCTVIGFPLGSNTIKIKAAEAREAVAKGAEEVDMVLNVGMLKSNELAFVQDDVAAVVSAAGKTALVKVILETCLLDPPEIALASLLCMEAGAHYIKTSTGFSSGGATAADVSLMRYVAGELMGVKASGGIKDRQIAREMLAAGATRLGASAGIAIIS